MAAGGASSAGATAVSPASTAVARPSASPPQPIISSFLAASQDARLYADRQGAGAVNVMPPSTAFAARYGPSLLGQRRGLGESRGGAASALGVDETDTQVVPAPVAAAPSTPQQQQRRKSGGARADGVDSAANGSEASALRRFAAGDPAAREAYYFQRAALLEDARLLRSLLCGAASDDDGDTAEVAAVKAVAHAKEQQRIAAAGGGGKGAKRLRRMVSGAALTLSRGSSFVGGSGGGSSATPSFIGDTTSAAHHSDDTQQQQQPPHLGGVITAAAHHHQLTAEEQELQALERRAALQSRLFMTPSKERALEAQLRAEREAAAALEGEEAARRREANRRRNANLTARQQADRETIRLLRTRTKSMGRLRKGGGAETSATNPNLLNAGGSPTTAGGGDGANSSGGGGGARRRSSAVAIDADILSFNTSFALGNGGAEPSTPPLAAHPTDTNGAQPPATFTTLREERSSSVVLAEYDDNDSFAISGNDSFAAELRRERAEGDAQALLGKDGRAAARRGSNVHGGGVGSNGSSPQQQRSPSRVGSFLTGAELAALRRLSEEQARDEHPFFGALRGVIERYVERQRLVEERAGLLTNASTNAANNTTKASNNTSTSRSGSQERRSAANNNASDLLSSNHSNTAADAYFASVRLQSLSAHMVAPANEKAAAVAAYAAEEVSLYTAPPRLQHLNTKGSNGGVGSPSASANDDAFGPFATNSPPPLSGAAFGPTAHIPVANVNSSSQPNTPSVRTARPLSGSHPPHGSDDTRPASPAADSNSASIRQQQQQQQQQHDDTINSASVNNMNSINPHPHHSSVLLRSDGSAARAAANVSQTREMQPYGIRRPPNAGSFEQNAERWERLRGAEHSRVTANEAQRVVNKAHTARLEAAFEVCDMPYDAFIYSPQLRRRPRQTPIYIQKSFAAHANFGDGAAEGDQRGSGSEAGDGSEASGEEGNERPHSRSRGARSGGRGGPLQAVMARRLPYLTRTEAAANRGAPLIGADHKLYPHPFLVVPVPKASSAKERRRAAGGATSPTPPSTSASAGGAAWDANDTVGGGGASAVGGGLFDLTVTSNATTNDTFANTGGGGGAKGGIHDPSSAVRHFRGVPSAVNTADASHYDDARYNTLYPKKAYATPLPVPKKKRGANVGGDESFSSALQSDDNDQQQDPFPQNGEDQHVAAEACALSPAGQQIRTLGREDPRTSAASVEYARKGGNVHTSSSPSPAAAHNTSIVNSTVTNPANGSLMARAASASGLVRGPGGGRGSGVMYYGGHSIASRGAASGGSSNAMAGGGGRVGGSRPASAGDGVPLPLTRVTMAGAVGTNLRTAPSSFLLLTSASAPSGSGGAPKHDFSYEAAPRAQSALELRTPNDVIDDASKTSDDRKNTARSSSSFHDGPLNTSAAAAANRSSFVASASTSLNGAFSSSPPRHRSRSRSPPNSAGNSGRGRQQQQRSGSASIPLLADGGVAVDGSPLASMHDGHNHQPMARRGTAAEGGHEAYYSAKLRRTSELVDYSPSLYYHADTSTGGGGQQQNQQQQRKRNARGGSGGSSNGRKGSPHQRYRAGSPIGAAGVVHRHRPRSGGSRSEGGGGSPMAPVGATPWNESFHITNAMKVRRGVGGAKKRNNSIFDVAGGSSPSTPIAAGAGGGDTTSSSKKKGGSKKGGGGAAAMAASPFESLDTRLHLHSRGASNNSHKAANNNNSSTKPFSSSGGSGGAPKSSSNYRSVASMSSDAIGASLLGGSRSGGGLLPASYYQSEQREIGARLREIQNAHNRLQQHGGGGADGGGGGSLGASRGSLSQSLNVGRKDLKREVEGLLDRFLTDNREEKFVPWRA